jgi:hypothetical protein
VASPLPLSVVVDDRPRMVTVVSNCYVCPHCVIFCMETKPWFRFGMAGVYFRENGRLPKAKVWCKNGCHERHGWGWQDITHPMFRTRHVPRA